MGEELNRSLQMLAERGVPRGAAAVLEEARVEATGVAESGGPSWRRGFTVAVATAAGALAAIGAVVLLVGPFGGEELPPATTQAPVVSTTIPVTPIPGAESMGPLNEVGDLAFAPDGYLWAATRGGLVQWDLADGTYVVFTEEDGIPGGGIETLGIAGDGTVWIAGASWIAHYDGSWEAFSSANVPELDGQLGSLAVDNDGVVWVEVADEPIAKFDGSWAEVPPPSGQGWSGIGPGLEVGPDGTLWVGLHNSGVFAFDGTSWRHFTEDDGVPAMVTGLVVAPDGTVWAWGEGYYTDAQLTTYVPGTGFARYDGTEWTTFTVEDGLLSNEGTVVVAADGSVSVVHAELGPDHEPVPIGVSRFDGTTWTAFADVDGNRGGPSRGAVAGADGTLWLPTASGIIGLGNTETTRLVVAEELATPSVAPFTLSPAPGQVPVRVSTTIGDFDFSTVYASPIRDVFTFVATPYGPVALAGDMLYWSTDSATWEGTYLKAGSLRITTDGADVVLFGDGFVRYAWDGSGWAEVAAVGLPGEVQDIAFGSEGAVALVDNTVYYSTGGLNFAPAEAGPVGVESGAGDKCAVYYSTATVAGDGIGPLLATEAGYLVLSPAAGPDWGRQTTDLCEPLVWSSADGREWELLTPQSPFGATAAIEDVASYGGRFVAMGGTSQPEEGAVWVSTDGVDWQRADVPRLGWARGIAGGELGWFLSGMEGGSGDGSLAVDMWFSADGVIWDGPYEGPEDLSWFYFRTEPSVGSDAIYSVNGTHDGLVVGLLEE